MDELFNIQNIDWANIAITVCGLWLLTVIITVVVFVLLIRNCNRRPPESGFMDESDIVK